VGGENIQGGHGFKVGMAEFVGGTSLGSI